MDVRGATPHGGFCKIGDIMELDKAKTQTYTVPEPIKVPNLPLTAPSPVQVPEMVPVRRNDE